MSFRVRLFITLASTLLTIAACSKKEPAGDSVAGEPPAPAAPVEQVAQTKPQASYEENSFKLELKPAASYRAGQEGHVEVVLEARSGFKCNDAYPYKFKTKETVGIAYPQPVIDKGAMQLEKQRAVMKIPFTPASAGDKTVSGTFAFSVCTEEKCLVERRELALSIPVE